jgi:drug/metabolite transporter (DMT)-like permease
MPARPWGAYALLAASMALVGCYVALSKPLLAALPVFVLAFLRFAIAAVAMLPWSLPRAGEAPLSRHEMRLFFLMSFFGNFLFSLAMLAGVRLTSATTAGVVLSTLPAVVAVMSWLFLRERVSPRVWVAIALAVVGIALLQVARGGGADGAGNDSAAGWLGPLLLLGAVVCEATYVIIGKRLAATRAPLRVSALINLWGLVLIAPLGLWQLSHTSLAAMTPPLWALLVFYALAASLFAVWLWMRGLQAVPAHQAGVFTVALPIAATLVGVGLLHEPFGLLQLAALGLASAGVLLVATAPLSRHGPGG